MPYSEIIAGLVEIVRIVAPLFANGANSRRMRRALDGIRKVYPQVKDSQARMVVEMIVDARKRGLTEEEHVVGYVGETLRGMDERLPYPTE